MGQTVWATPYYNSSELTDTTNSVRMLFDDDAILVGVRTSIVVYNNPTFTDLYMRIYSDDSNSPKKLLATSTNLLAKANVHTLSNAIKEIPFTLDNFNVKGGEHYHFVLQAHGYTGSTTAFLAWMKAYPDPVYPVTGGLTYPSSARAPYQIYCIGADL